MRDIHTRVTDEEHAAAAAFAEESDVTLSALASALCRWASEQNDPAREPTPEVDRCVKRIVEDARRIDTERRSRRPEG